MSIFIKPSIHSVTGLRFEKSQFPHTRDDGARIYCTICISTHSLYN